MTVDPAVRDQFKFVLEDLLRRLDVVAQISITDEPLGLRADITSDDSALLIGWRGMTLASLEYITRVLMAQRVGDGTQLPELHIDVGGYRQRQVDEIVDLAKRTADDVRAKGASEILRPMNAFERRIVHMTLAEMDDLATESIGADPNRRIIIKPRT